MGLNSLEHIFSIPLTDHDPDKYLIYAPLKGTAFIANPALVNILADLSNTPEKMTPKWPSDPRVRNFLLTLDLFSHETEAVVEESARNVDTVVLFLTNRCNLKCSYCYASANQYVPSDMSEDLAAAAVRFVYTQVLQNRSEQMTLAFHGGGEPFMNFAVMKSAVSCARRLTEQNKVELKIAGSSNGVWSETVCRYVLENFTEISLSIDGMSETQNRQRPGVCGTPSFPTVMKTVDRLDRAGFSYGIRMTVTDISVGKLAENVRFLSERTGARAIQVEPVFHEGRAVANHEARIVPEQFVEQFKAAYKIARNNGKHLFYSGARPEVLAKRFCLSTESAFVVTPEGDVTTCFEIHNRSHPLSDALMIGSYDGTNFCFSKDRRQISEMQQVDSISSCRDCFCRWHCAGDCFVRRENRLSGNMAPDGEPVRCYLTREITKFLLCDKIVEAGGVICSDTWKV